MLSVARERVEREVEQAKAAAKQRMIDEFEAAFEALQMETLMQMEEAEAEGAGSSSGDQGGGQSESDHTCCVCMAAPRDASLVHGETAHICCCLECARTLKAKGNSCPICNDPIDAVLRIFFS